MIKIYKILNELFIFTFPKCIIFFSITAEGGYYFIRLRETNKGAAKRGTPSRFSHIRKTGEKKFNSVFVWIFCRPHRKPQIYCHNIVNATFVLYISLSLFFFYCNQQKKEVFNYTKGERGDFCEFYWKKMF